MSKHGTASRVEGGYVEFQIAVLRNLPRDISPELQDEWVNNGEALSRVLRGVLMLDAVTIIKLISAGHNLVLGACDGTKIIAKAKKTFPSGVDSDFVRWGANEPGQPSPATVPDVYEMARDATFSQMLGFLGANIADVGSMRKLCLTQHQIIDFVEKYPNWLLTDGYGTFFLFQSHGEFFVAFVGVDSDGLYVRVYRFEDSSVWCADCRHRVVVPQLA